MTKSFNFTIKSFEGALPIFFGMPRAEAHQILGTPTFTRHPMKKMKVPGDLTDYWLENCVNVAYDSKGKVKHLGFIPGDFTLKYQKKTLWTPRSGLDPNPFLLSLDKNPRECFGFLVFTSLGITTTGFHDQDKSQRALTLFPKNAWDGTLKQSTDPDLSLYSVTD